MGLSTHILDTALGRPAAGVRINLVELRNGVWTELAGGVTDADGRCKTVLGDMPLEATTYELTFVTEPYFEAQGLSSLYPHVKITFTIADPSQHYHIPLLLTANGYTTYRGS
jgi:5-hydroxyisourate hydrolase